MIDLPEKFIQRMSLSLGTEMQDFLASYEKPTAKGIRINSLKISAEDFKKLSPLCLSQVEWESNGFYTEEVKPGKSPYHNAGLFYVQEPSAMCAAPMLDVQEGERVLDLCSAPGGKGTRLAEYTNGKGIVFLNEIVFDRAKILSQNVERLGIKNAVVTCASPKQLSEVFVGYFDKILVDAPCSGEGMFKKEPNAIPEWSEENVTHCAERQKEILDCAKIMLKRGGKLVYSTCTFAEVEDELQIQDFLQNNEEFTLIKQEKLYPHKVFGEGHYAALLEKIDGDEGKQLKLLQPVVKDSKLLALYKDFEKSFLKIKFNNLHLIGDNLYSLPDEMPKTPIQTLRAGVHLGEFIKNRFQPSHSLAMCLKKEEVATVDVSEDVAKSYLLGNTFACDESLSGWAVVTLSGYPIGWCKCVNGQAKNHLPKALRINQ